MAVDAHSGDNFLPEPGASSRLIWTKPYPMGLIPKEWFND